MDRSSKLPYSAETEGLGSLGLLIVVMALLICLPGRMGFAQKDSSPPSGWAVIQGTVRDPGGELVADATVVLEEKDRPGSAETKTNANGAFTFPDLQAGTYQLSSEKAGLRSSATGALVLSPREQKHVDLVLEGANGVPAKSGASSPVGSMEFADQPNFTVAGVTDWTAAGGHGSDVSLRTSEDLAREAIVLKPASPMHSSSGPVGNSHAASESESKLRAAIASDPASFAANHQLGEFYLRAGRYSDAVPLLEAAERADAASRENTYDLALACQGVGDFSKARDHVQALLVHEDNGDLHRLLGELDERLSDPLDAVREDEKAVRLDPSEQNYFQWGSELLLHRAVQPAVEVFSDGAKAHPKSERMLAALGAALFAGGHNDEAAQRVCSASDLNLDDPAPYIFLGKIQMAAPSPLECVASKLARFVQQQPGNALANYYYAMTIWKDEKSAENARQMKEIEALLIKAVTVDPNFDDAYLQLGILHFAERDFNKAIDFYAKAIAINPQLSAAHYRLGVAYARVGEQAKAKQEFQLYNQLDKQEAAAIEGQRREIKQFMIVLNTQPGASATN